MHICFLSVKFVQVMSSPSVALADTMYNMNIQTPTRPTPHCKTLGQVAQAATPHQQPALQVSSGPGMGPGGDAQVTIEIFIIEKDPVS